LDEEDAEEPGELKSLKPNSFGLMWRVIRGMREYLKEGSD
jgi:hypothetical protein